jgi:hypothetical protein
MDIQTTRDLLKLHLSIWSERDEQKRITLITEVYDEGIEIIDPFFLVKGYAPLNQFIQELQEKHSGYNFSINGAIEAHHDIARLFWHFGPENDPATISGQDIFVIGNGKIKTVMVFIDNLS